MGKIKLTAKKEAVDQAAGGDDWGDPPKPGLYHLRLEGIELRDNKEGTGKYLSVRWKPIGTGREGTKPEEKIGAVWDNVSTTSEASEWSRARLAIALGAKPNRAGNVTLDIELDPDKPGNPIGTVVLGRVKGGKNNLTGDYEANLGWYGPLEVSAESGEDDGFADEEDASEESGEETEDDEFGEDEASEDNELLTSSDLENMENKELGVVAKDFDIDTKSFVKKVKGKTVADRAGLIDAILEAQGADADTTDEEGDDPF